MGCGAASARYEFDYDAGSETNAEVDTSSPISLGGQWFYEASPDEWQPMDAEISAELLVAYYCGESQVIYCIGGKEFEVDFLSCEQTSKDTGIRQRIGWVPSDPDSEQLEEETVEDHTPDAAEGTWVEYDEDDMQQVLAAWASGSKVVRYTSDGCEFEIDFTKMLQTNLTTGAQQWISVEMLDDSSPTVYAGDQPSTQWMQYTDPESGKPYYYNGLMLQWERPSGDGVQIFTEKDFANNASSQGRANSKEVARERSNMSTDGEQVRKEKANLDVPQKAQKKYSLARDPPAQATTQSSHESKQRQQKQFYTPEAPPFNPEAATRYNSSADWQPPWQPSAPQGRFPDVRHKAPPEAPPLHPSAPQDPPYMNHASAKPQARFYKAASSSKPRPKAKQREKKYTLGPEKSVPRQPQQIPKPKQIPKPQPRQPPFTHTASPQQEATPPRTDEKPAKQQTKPIDLPIGAEWPTEPKAKKVAETLFRDMCASRGKPLKERQKAYRASCLSWHPDKNPKYVELSTEVFKFLQVLKQWYFEEQKPEPKTAT